MSIKTRACYSADCDECGVDWAELADSEYLAGSPEDMREWWEDEGGVITEDGRWLCSECVSEATR